MNSPYLVLASRMRQEIEDVAQTVQRAEAAMAAMEESSKYGDLLLDSAALNLHDFYSGLERIFQHLAGGLDGSIPEGRDWHQELLCQMTVELPQIRPAVIGESTRRCLDEFLRFRHVVRNVYAFDFDRHRIESLVEKARPCFGLVRTEILAFADVLQQLAQDE